MEGGSSAAQHHPDEFCREKGETGGGEALTPPCPSRGEAQTQEMEEESGGRTGSMRGGRGGGHARRGAELGGTGAQSKQATASGLWFFVGKRGRKNK